MQLADQILSSEAAQHPQFSAAVDFFHSGLACEPAPASFGIAMLQALCKRGLSREETDPLRGLAIQFGLLAQTYAAASVAVAADSTHLEEADADRAATLYARALAYAVCRAAGDLGLPLSFHQQGSSH